MYNYDRGILHRGITKAALLLTGIISLMVFGDRVQAQTPSGASNAIQNSGSISPGRLDNARPIRQQNFLIDSGGGSQQFFRQGGDKLYLLPEEKSKPILKIDEALETEEVDQQDLPDNSTQE